MGPPDGVSAIASRDIKNSQAQDASQVVWKLDTRALLPLAKYFLLRINQYR